ncbi:hypothetical protein X777_12668 [Ooceraea biroi]|uniref:Uncharacterized protein n=1 Tax=Ooceraea biroi TaxID=2015173 RepID=A0A026W068_OOCBI|nr:hypothetical protein X777_12668 [Ooceraea biroi]
MSGTKITKDKERGTKCIIFIIRTREESPSIVLLNDIYLTFTGPNTDPSLSSR